MGNRQAFPVFLEVDTANEVWFRIAAQDRHSCLSFLFWKEKLDKQECLSYLGLAFSRTSSSYADFQRSLMFYSANLRFCPLAQVA
jgi:hypothetical protein